MPAASPPGAPPLARHEPASTERSVRCIAGRYRLSGLLGRGGNGEVWEAEDALTGTLVAVKLLGDGAVVEPARVRREVAALRLLRIPGVVQLLDEGVDGACAFLVMGRISGAPFPGRARRTWTDLAGTAAALLETLARVHAAGVVHRDLKPGNVLVDEEGRPTILDFGLSFGPSLGEGLTGEGRILGTPDYLAPEQILGEPVTPATDLYAFGAMLYEALSGRLPHEVDDFQSLLRARLTATPIPLGELAPDVPAPVAAVVDALLARAPEERPRSAEEVLDRWREQRPSSAFLPGYLGDRAAVARLIEAARAGRSMDLVGLPGAGRTRCLQEVAAALAAQGIEGIWTEPGRHPFASLAAVTGPLNEHSGPGLAEVAALVNRRLAEVLGAGKVLFADNPSRIDRWSATAIDEARSKGVVLRVVDLSLGETQAVRDDVVALEALKEVDLRPLFDGPDRAFHLCEDAARELFVRTFGLPARVMSELAAWERAGQAQRTGARWCVDRASLDRLAAGRIALPLPPLLPAARPREGPSPKMPAHLEDLAAWIELAWPHTRVADLARITDRPPWRIEAEVDDLCRLDAVLRLSDGRLLSWGAKGVVSRMRQVRRASAHRTIARALSPGSEGRLFHLIAGQGDRDASDPAEVVAETLALAAPLLLEGHLGRATELLADGLLAARRAAEGRGGDWGEGQLLGRWVETALSQGTPRALDRALYEVCRASRRTGEVESLEHLLRAALAMRTTAGDRALSLIEGSVSPFADPDLERRRQHVRVQSARLCSAEREEAVLAEVERWAREAGDEQAQASFADWMGRLRYRQGRFDEAAALHAKAAAGERWITERIGALLNGASALLEAHRPDEAARVAAEARDLAVGCRHSYYEVRSEWLARAASYRRGDPLVPDEELVDLAAWTGVSDLEALVCLNEAAVAWRAGRGDLAATLARRTQHIWTGTGKAWGALFARVLSVGVSGTTPDEARALAEEARRCPVSGAGIQMLGLLGRACPEIASGLLPEMVALRASIPERSWSVRMDVLSVDEAFEASAGAG